MSKNQLIRSFLRNGRVKVSPGGENLWDLNTAGPCPGSRIILISVPIPIPDIIMNPDAYPWSHPMLILEWSPENTENVR